jgi:hypothetical protein
MQEMKHNYSQAGYHPKAVSFEVSAILLDEEKKQALCKATLQSGMLQNYNTYSRFMALGFNALTDQETTYKYTNQAHKLAGRRNKNIKLKQEVQNDKLKMHLFRRVFHELIVAFDIVIQNMLARYFQGIRGLTKSQATYINFLDVGAVEDSLKHKNTIHAMYSLHPHVDALLKERQNHAHTSLSHEEVR